MSDTLHREAVYEAAVDDDAFAALPQLLADSVGARSCTLHWREAEGARGIFAHSGYFSDDQLQTYADRFADDDLWTLEAVRLPNRAWRCSDLVSEADYRRSRFYNDWIRGMGDDTYHCTGAVMSTHAGFGIVGLHRGRTQRDFDEADVARLAALAPDLRRMFALRMRLQRLEGRIGELEAVIAAAAEPLFVVDAAGRILMTNPAAEALLAEGTALCSVKGRLVAAGEVRPALGTLIAAATATRGATGGNGFVRSRTGRALPISATPLPGAPGIARALVSVRAAAEAEQEAAITAMLRQDHGLSPAEAEVALLLAEGHSLAEIAARRATAVSTVRAQLSAILSKTALNRQGQVIKLVADLRR